MRKPRIAAVFAAAIVAKSALLSPHASRAQTLSPDERDASAAEWIYENPRVSGRCDVDKVPDRAACIAEVDRANGAAEQVLLAHDAIVAHRASLERTLRDMDKYRPAGVQGFLGGIVDALSGGREEIMGEFKDAALTGIARSVDKCEAGLRVLDGYSTTSHAAAQYAASMLRFLEKHYDIRQVCTLQPVKGLDGPGG